MCGVKGVFFQEEGGIRGGEEMRGLGDVYRGQIVVRDRG